jgi:hypothetical protein
MSFSRLEFYKCINFSLNFFEHRHGEPVLTFTTLMEQTLAAMTYNVSDHGATFLFVTLLFRTLW